MAQPSKEQVAELETAMMDQFQSLIQGARFRINLSRLADPDKPLSQDKTFMDYGNAYRAILKKWVDREVIIEKALLKQGIKGIIASGSLRINDFFTIAGLKKVEAILETIKVKPAPPQPSQSIGFPPVIIYWTVLGLAALYTALTITDAVTTTTEEREDLMKTTLDTCKKLKLSNEQCQRMITSTQAQVDKGGGFLDKLILPAVGLGALFIFLSTRKSKTQLT